MDVKDAVALLEFLPKTVLAVTALAALIAFRKPIVERLLPNLRSAEV
jgi:hypothetical protein